MNNEERSLISKFKDLEKKMIDILKTVDISLDDNADSKTVKANLKQYISKVRDVESLFAEYEKIASDIEKLTAEEEKSAGKSISEAVVDMREVSPETAAEIQNINGQVIVKNKVKKNNTAVKEF